MDRETEMRRMIVASIRGKIPHLLLMSLPLLLACVVLFGASHLVVAVVVYLGVMCVLGALLVLLGYCWWHYRTLPLLRRSEAARAAIAARQQFGSDGPGSAWP